MSGEYYNLPMVRENFVSRNIKKIFQGFFNIKRKKRDQRRAQILAQRAKKDRIFSVQYHPESAPGPQDSSYLFDKFISLLEENKN